MGLSGPSETTFTDPDTNSPWPWVEIVSSPKGSISGTDRQAAVLRDLQIARDTQGARIDVQISEFRAEMDTRFTRLEAATETHFAEIRAEIKSQGSRIESIESRINDLR